MNFIRKKKLSKGGTTTPWKNEIIFINLEDGSSASNERLGRNSKEKNGRKLEWGTSNER